MSHPPKKGASRPYKKTKEGGASKSPKATTEEAKPEPGPRKEPPKPEPGPRKEPPEEPGPRKEPPEEPGPSQEPPEEPGPSQEPPGPSQEPPEEPIEPTEPTGDAATAKMVKAIGSLDEFQKELENAGDKLIVVDFSATWCGPCKMIKPFYHIMSEKYKDVTFLEVDVDDAQDVSAHCDVKCMPTFQFYKNKEKVHEFSGANKEKLEETIKKLQ